ncbi:PadR family transcriptional regulator [Paenalkalicoccus suaedae]|uniref:PadR family transcriptional regulator n=1 Tax=Paenalkalicoccus suaedae TaxID=2592382 RepID=A0A859FBA7_9BACI|nr:PadR family transcriptional regulator [Paenalkalicoccus suaedae]QKS69951.1 PadR family transcriptional regulator [Paenalkalicoccus suaedae]
MENNSTWHTQFSKGILELTILVILKKRPMYGYEITQSIRQDGVLHVGNGSIYPILRRLVEQEWISAYEEEHAGRTRKYYQLTKDGQTQLTARLTYTKELMHMLTRLDEEGADDAVSDN